MSARPSDELTSEAALPAPPRPARRPTTLTAHGHTRVDPYCWLRDDEREDPAVIAHLEAENAYTQAMLQPTQRLQRELRRELADRLEPEEMSVPVQIDGYWYYSRYLSGSEHPIHARRLGSMEADEQILLDTDARAAHRDFYELGDVAISEDHSLIAFSEDTTGREQFDVRIRDLTGRRDFGELIENTSGSLAFDNSGELLYYVRLKEGTLTPYQLVRHRLGTQPGTDVVLYEEADPAFCVEIEKSRSREQILVYLISTLSTEVLLLNAADAQAVPRRFLAREPAHEYWIEPVGEVAWVITNWQAANFRLMYTRLEHSAQRERWREIIGHRDDVLLEDFVVFDDYLAIEERHDGIQRLRIRSHDGRIDYRVDIDESVYTAEIDENPRLDTTILRFGYSSLRMPGTTCELDMASGVQRLLKRDDVGGAYEPEDYETRRVHAPARDGASIPVTLFYRKGLRNDASHPLYLLGYGAYGDSYDPEFDTDKLSLIDRGVVYAIAHVRGGQECGRRWYTQGRGRQKMNSFTDYIDATEYLAASGWAAADQIIAAGSSAGGLLVGAVANMRPDLYRAVVTDVPFVDVVTTMFDQSIPLTSFEFDEWGDPRKPLDYFAMLAYSPYDGVRAQRYPHMLISTALWDTAVPYWEPAKWVARLRESKTDDHLLLLHVDMDAGHRGQSGRYRQLLASAREYAFILRSLNLDDDLDG